MQGTVGGGSGFGAALHHQAQAYAPKLTPPSISAQQSFNDLHQQSVNVEFWIRQRRVLDINKATCDSWYAQEAILSNTWVIILSIIPSDLVRTGALLLTGVIVTSHIVHAIRPRDLMEELQMQLLCLEEKLKAAIDSGIMAQADVTFTAQIERRLGRYIAQQ
ncbi:uncharacterized protein LACBIDRAFT_323260 [Laccaria bicolor S238N-H82]|uniref:Predicted protein n=1 Tax=Laccaria bicolor (strain S238N-H82 / ATCC MYA-4686) TaxID=486041 RepID=B0CZM8_LACBS|nr:uncharacterized protein LACBIDRAFT_323260 [Laccaria bicolor S238N-H82]EDR12647.1 predicted protein [Laccaria bicolor S238N-H82]|eukprot:XP_001876911.1 predicted protein [Laccaria bicolor S238N-H82]